MSWETPGHCCRQLSIISSTAPTEATLCACQAPVFHSLLAATQGSRASQPASTGGKTRAENRRGEQSQDGGGELELRAESWSPREPSEWLSPQSHLLVPWPQAPCSQPSWALCRGVAGDASLGISGQQLPLLAGAFHNRNLLGCWGLAIGASAVPHDVFQVVLLLRNLLPRT